MVSKYVKRLTRDLPRWADEGLIKDANIEAILSDATRQTRKISLANIIAILGAILLCFAAITLVAANWQIVPRLVKLTALIALLWAGYFATWICFKRQIDWLAHAALLVTSALFGANIMLIAQMYHMQGDAPTAVLIWACGALLAGALVRSTPSLILAVGLFAVWSGMQVRPFSGNVHYPFLIAWIACGLVVRFITPSRLSAHLMVVILIGWLFAANDFGLSFVGKNVSHMAIWSVPVLLFAVSMLIESSRRYKWLNGFELAAIAYLMIFLFSATFMVQFLADMHGPRITSFADSGWAINLYQFLPFALVSGGATYLAIRARNRGEQWLTHAMIAIWSTCLIFLLITLRTPMGHTFFWASLAAILFIFLSIWTIHIGDRLENTTLKAIGFVGFGAELLYIYFRTIGGFLGTTLLFFFGGAIMIITALIFMQREKKLKQQNGEEK